MLAESEEESEEDDNTSSRGRLHLMPRLLEQHRLTDTHSEAALTRY
jgi:hypothetical protein